MRDADSHARRKDGLPHLIANGARRTLPQFLAGLGSAVHLSSGSRAAEEWQVAKTRLPAYLSLRRSRLLTTPRARSPPCILRTFTAFMNGYVDVNFDVLYAGARAGAPYGSNQLRNFYAFTYPEPAMIRVHNDNYDLVDNVKMDYLRDNITGRMVFPSWRAPGTRTSKMLFTRSYFKVVIVDSLQDISSRSSGSDRVHRGVRSNPGPRRVMVDKAMSTQPQRKDFKFIERALNGHDDPDSHKVRTWRSSCRQGHHLRRVS